VERNGRTSRRQLLKIGGLGALGAVGIAGAATAAGAATSRSLARIPLPGLRELRRATFEPLVGTQFTLEVPGGTQNVVLTSVVAHPTARPGKGECFSLLFSTPKRPAVSGSYHLGHPSLGTFGMFLSPVGPPRDGQCYEAVVNRY